MSKSVGVLGSGAVGLTLAKGLKDIGYSVVLANRTGHKVDGWTGEVVTYEEASSKSDILVLAVKGTSAEHVVSGIKSNLNGKVVIDTTNPIADAPPDDGVIQYFTTLDNSLMERLQGIAPNAKFVKAFNSVGSAYMVKPQFKGGTPTMFICGNDLEAKEQVSSILSKLGWEAQDFGGAKSARAIEPLCVLWCIPGLTKNEWSHAFKLLRA